MYVCYVFKYQKYKSVELGDQLGNNQLNSMGWKQGFPRFEQQQQQKQKQ